MLLTGQQQPLGVCMPRSSWTHAAFGRSEREHAREPRSRRAEQSGAPGGPRAHRVRQHGATQRHTQSRRPQAEHGAGGSPCAPGPSRRGQPRCPMGPSSAPQTPESDVDAAGAWPSPSAASPAGGAGPSAALNASASRRIYDDNDASKLPKLHQYAYRGAQSFARAPRRMCGEAGERDARTDRRSAQHRTAA